MKCTECGREIEDNKKFCKYCGALVKPHSVSEQKAEQVARCKACGAVLKPGTAFCTQCGTPISQAVNTSAKAPFTKPGKKGKKAGKIVIGVMTLIEVLLVAFIGYYFANQDGLFDQKESRRKTELISDTTEENTSSYDDENENVTKDVEDKNADESVATSASLDNNVIDVDELVLNIREKYNKIRNGIDSNSYDTVIVNDGVMAYFNQKQLSAIVVKKNYASSNYISSNYTRYFYYDGGEIFFAYYEGNDSHRLYFDGEKLYRWRYCSDASDNSKVVDYDQENTSEYRQWENCVLADAKQFKSLWENAVENGVGTQDYVLTGSDMRYVSKSELKNFTAEQCRLARNEIYARHGRIFNDESIQNYFNSKDWYVPSVASGDFKESVLNEYEIANRDIIVEYEKERGYR